MVSVICGNFNEVQSAKERKIGKIDHEGLIGLNLGGRTFTWKNTDHSKLSKLDCFLVFSKIERLSIKTSHNGDQIREKQFEERGE
ncbi:hypothetical protein OSB04_027997 [Centaurea solstitialis]|uniref:Uncharacterized protein n=1 Tax=Centaurea solstitialis TaxID=347529 RepID=A0AA38WAR1_9ASTR|nr:hypothetical protein OSB04_027997 [Centaurea solstitialis]